MKCAAIVCFFVGALAGVSGEVIAACERKSIDVKSVARSGIVCAPVFDASPAPVVLAFHGRGGSGRRMAESTSFHTAWPQALVVYLDGLPGNPAPYDTAGLKPGWQINVGDLDNRDVAFVDAALEMLSRHYSIDRRQVFAVGHSNGARLVGILWSLRGQAFAALAFSAAQAGALIETAPPRPVFMGMGLRDTVVPFEMQRRSIHAAAVRFGAGPIESVREGKHVAKNGDGLELVSFIHGGGHAWPPGQTAMIVDFFKRQAPIRASMVVPRLAGLQ